MDTAGTLGADAELRPVIFWEGLPPCGLLMKQVVNRFGNDIRILGTRPAVPFEGLEQLLGHKVDWLDSPSDIWKRRHEFSDRNLVIHTGWSHSGWLRFDRWMKKRGATVVVAVDNCFKGNVRQMIGALWFRVWLRQHFDAAFVPGVSAARLMRFLGMPASRIFTGYYGAFEEIYVPGPEIETRRKEFLFVGQLIRRKGVDVMLEAFASYRARGGDWNLRIVGGGAMKNQCRGEGIIFEGFSQTRKTALHMREARCLILPSREDHWGTVVCEAAASGTLIIASRWVGSVPDLVRHGINGYVFQEMSADSLEKALSQVSRWDETTLKNGQAVSLGLARGYTSASYMAAFKNFSPLA
jgi:glycosyltransferase involved in cell wall biosynthesis